MNKEVRLKSYNEIMTGLMSQALRTLHDFGYKDANAQNLFTEPIYATLLFNDLTQVFTKAKSEDVKMVCLFLESKITCDYGNLN